MNKILVVCGSGIATSTAAVAEIEEKLAERNLRAEIVQCDVFTVNSNLKGVSLIASTCALDGEYGVPVVNVVPLLTGIGVDKVMDNIAAILDGQG